MFATFHFLVIGWAALAFLNFHEDYQVVLTRERKRDGPRHSTTTFSEIVAVAETSSKC